LMVISIHLSFFAVVSTTDRISACGGTGRSVASSTLAPMPAVSVVFLKLLPRIHIPFLTVFITLAPSTVASMSALLPII
jgi:hypothetical protein